jgi:hypothetical protein
MLGDEVGVMLGEVEGLVGVMLGEEVGAAVHTSDP